MENVEALTGLTLEPTLPQTTVQPQPTPYTGNPLGVRSTIGGYTGLTGLPAMSYGQTGFPGAYTSGYPGFTGAYTGGYPGAYPQAYPGAYGGFSGYSGYGGYQPGLRSSLLAQPLAPQPVVLDNTNPQDTVTARVEETLRRSRVIGEALQRSRVYGTGQFPGLNSRYANLYGGTGYGYPRSTYGQTLAPQVVAPQVAYQAPQTYVPQVPLQQSYLAPQQTYIAPHPTYVPQSQYAPQVQQSYFQQPTVIQQPVQQPTVVQQPVLQQQTVLQQPRTVLQQSFQQPFQQVVSQPLRRSLNGLTPQPYYGSGVYNGSYGGFGGYPYNRGVQRLPYGQAPLYGTTPVDQGYRDYVLRKSKELVEQQAMQDQEDEFVNQ